MSGLAAARWQVLGTSVLLQVMHPGVLAQARAIVERELEAIDCACSRSRADSELSRVNAAAGRRVHVAPLLIEALQVALRAAELTEGDVDPTVGPVSAQPSRPSMQARGRSSWRTVELDPMRRTIRVPAGIQLDLSATAKALAADRAAGAAARGVGAGVLVSLGGEISTSGESPAEGWRVRVTDSHQSDLSAPGQTISILSGGLAIASTAVRRWRREDRAVHQIIDPDIDSPVTDTWRTASVAAANCVDANIASTAALVRAQHAPEWLDELGLPARLVDQAGRVRNLGDWPVEPGVV
jgi:FAD:protein FMN transferase